MPDFMDCHAPERFGRERVPVEAAADTGDVGVGVWFGQGTGLVARLVSYME